MNTKKHKNKNRGQPNPIPHEKLDTREAAKTIEDPQNSDNTTKKEVFQDVSDLKSVEEIQPLVETPIKPKRNKGKKKKSDIVLEQDDGITVKDIDNIKTENIFDNKKDVSKPSDDQEDCNMQPNARKKKNKGKKEHKHSSEEVKKDPLEINTTVIDEYKNSENKPLTDTDEMHTDAKLPKKKNKKKKRRLDSEKSDKADEIISCTKAFQEFVNKNENHNTDDKEIKTDNIKLNSDKNEKGQVENLINEVKSFDEMFETNIKPEEKCAQIDEIKLKNDTCIQKKKKKEKKRPPKPNTDDSVICEQTVSLDRHKGETSFVCDVSKPDNISDDGEQPKEKLVHSANVEHQDLTPKAKIAKPVQKRSKKNRAQPADIMEKESNTLTNINDKTFEEAINASISPNLENEKEVKGENKLNFIMKNKEVASLATETSTNIPKEELDNILKNTKNLTMEETNIYSLDDAIKETCGELFENLKTRKELESDSKAVFDVKTAPDNKSEENKHLQTPQTQFSIEDGLATAIQTLANDETSNNDRGNIGSSSTQNIQQSPTTDLRDQTTTNEDSVNTPDCIEIPRSSSQQILDDNNNNTIIHELTSTDEIKLGIPVLTSNMIQGSGETPVTTPKIIPSNINVTEIETIPNKEKNAEKTDLKSKMMEVNQDLEDIRISLEKSLAELTSVDKSETNVAKLSTDNIETKNIEDNLISDNTKFEDTTVKPLADRLNEIENKCTEFATKLTDIASDQKSTSTPPICPARKDRKNKGKAKKKGKKEPELSNTQNTNVASNTSSTSTNDSKSENKNEEKSESSKEKVKQQATCGNSDQTNSKNGEAPQMSYEPIDNFEDALTSSVDDVNKTFDIIANEISNQTHNHQEHQPHNNPEISITPPVEDTEKEDNQNKTNPVSQPKNLLGHPNIPVQSNKTDYKKEKNKTPNSREAKVNIKDSVEIDTNGTAKKHSKECQTNNKRKPSKDNYIESFSYMTNENEEYVYKYSFRKVFLTSACHVCKKELKQTRVPCKFCNLVFYCCQKHKDEDWSQHQSLCFAVSTIVHLKDQKYIYADAKNMLGQNYRLVRMQMILSCEKVLKRKLVPWEQEALLYPRLCADVKCREWRQSKLSDCEGCGQISYCTDHPEHLPSTHERWCKSYALYQKLVLYQQTCGRLEPKLPSRVMKEGYIIPEKINEVLASMYEDKIDMSDIQYAALTQLATAPLTTAYCHQLYRQMVNYSNGITMKSTFTIHAVGAELQFEADTLNKWEVFFLHLKPDVKELKVVLIGPELNPSELPLDLLGKIKLCNACRINKRRVVFSFQDKQTYHEYCSGDDFGLPDIVCAFNPGIQRYVNYNEKDTWSSTISCIMKLKTPFVITSYTKEELQRDVNAISSYVEDYKVISAPNYNPFASVRPDRNFLSDDETPLLFKNYCLSVLCGV